MTKQGWLELVHQAVKRSNAGDPELIALLVELLYEQDKAKDAMRYMGFGCIGTPWEQVTDEVRQFKNDAR